MLFGQMKHGGLASVGTCPKPKRISKMPKIMTVITQPRMQQKRPGSGAFGSEHISLTEGGGVLDCKRGADGDETAR